MKLINLKSVLILIVFLILGIKCIVAQEIELTSSEVWLRGANTYGYLRFLNNGTLLYDKTLGAPDGNAFHINVASNCTQGLKITKNWASPSVFCVYSDGTAYLKNLAVTSDSRLKDDVLPLSSQTENLKKLQGVSYKWKEDDGKGMKGDKRTYGLLAQDLEKVYPDMVFTDEDGNMSIYYTELIPVLINVAKEQQVLLDAQQMKIADMEKRLQALEKKSK